MYMKFNEYEKISLNILYSMVKRKIERERSLDILQTPTTLFLCKNITKIFLAR